MKEGKEYWLDARNEDDITKRINLLTKGASLGDKLCLNELGEIYMMGKGVPQDEKKAVEYLQKAAKAGIPNAMYLLSLILAKHGDQESIDCLCASAQGCHIPAFIAIERNFGSEPFVQEVMLKMEPKFEEVMKKADKEAYEYRFLALCYIYGVVCRKDENKARAYLQKAADMGDYHSSYILSSPNLRAE